MPRGDKPTTKALALKDGWIYEDALPDTITKDQYDWWYGESLVLDGVRIGPRLPDPVCRFCDQAIYFAGDEWRHRFNESAWCKPKAATPRAPVVAPQETDLVSRKAIVERCRELEAKFNWQLAGEVAIGIRQFVETLAAAPLDHTLVVAPQGDAKFTPPAEDALRVAICQAVQEHHAPSANAILREALNDYKPTQLTRTELIRAQQRSGSGEVAAVMVSPASSPASSPVSPEQERDFGPRSRVDDWPIVDVLGHLASATEHLLQHHNCDEHGHEMWKYAAEAAWKHVALLNRPAATPTPVEREHGTWNEAASIVQACLNVHSTYTDAEREFAAHLIEVFTTKDQHPDYKHRNTVRAYPTATPSAERAAEEIILYANQRSGHAEGDEWFNDRDMKAVKKIVERHCSPVSAAGGDGECAWTLDDSNDGDFWETGCGEAFRFTDGGPTDNGFVFCYKCGKRISAGRYSDHATDSVGEEGK